MISECRKVLKEKFAPYVNDQQGQEYGWNIKVTGRMKSDEDREAKEDGDVADNCGL